MYRSIGVFLTLLFCSCASVPPPWYGEYPDSLNEYYDQGSGSGKSIDEADRNAQISLIGKQQGVDIKSVLESEKIEESGDKITFEAKTRKGDVVKVSGKLPPGAYIAEHWRDKSSGSWWSYALWEKPGKERRIQQLRNARLGAARLRSVLPGWAQFTKGQKQKGWRLIYGTGGGLVGFATFAILQSDFESRRDRVRGTGRSAASDRQYYDDWANRFYWGSVAFGTLAGASYLGSLIDGITTVPPTYRLLLSRVDWELWPAKDGLVLGFAYDLK